MIAMDVLCYACKFGVAVIDICDFVSVGVRLSILACAGHVLDRLVTFS